MAAVTLHNLVKVYPGEGKNANFTAVKNIDLEIREGEFMVLVGPSGCSKSTTLRMIAGLESITGGEIHIDGRRVNEVAPKVPFYVPSETSEMRITATDTGVFWDQLTTDAGGSSTESVVVFVHGYSYDFERGCDRAAEVQRALQGKMAVVMTSVWLAPSV